MKPCFNCSREPSCPGEHDCTRLDIQTPEIKDLRIRELINDYTEGRRSLDEVVTKIKEL